MAVELVPTADHCNLPEYTVGQANSSCNFPGIQQCFAIAGWTSTGMLCTHVSPGASKGDIKDTFNHLKRLGGRDARYWYVLGPFNEHFKTQGAQWKTVEDIKTTFDKVLSNGANCRFIVDASEERQIHTWGITIRAEHRSWEGMIKFSYAPSMGKNSNTFQSFEEEKFRPF